MKSLWQLRSFARPYLWMLVIVLVLMGITAGTGALALAKTQSLFRPIVGHATSDPLQQALHAALVVLGLLVAAALCEGMSIYGAEWVGQWFLYDLRRALFRNLERLSLRFFEGRQAGEIVSRINSDTMILQRVIGTQLGPALLSPMAAVACIVVLFKISWSMTLLVMVLVPLVAWVNNVLGRRLRRYVILFQQRLADLAVVVDETFSMMRVVKIFGMEERIARRFEKTALGVLRAELRSARMRALNIPAVGSFVGVAMCIALLAGTREVILGRIPSEALLTFVIVMQRTGSYINRLSRIWLSFQRAEAAAQRTLELLSLQPDLEDAPDAQELVAPRGEIKFENVSFAYQPQVEVLKDINLTIHPGEVLAIVGPSGSGKSTLANLVARLYDVTCGRVLIDGIDVRKIKQDSLRRYIGIVPQEAVLFSGTIRENIGFGREDATEEQIIAAAKVAAAHEFITALPEGYDTQVGERGTKLSGGERQRIAIARAIIRDPRILILDEATSALDRTSEAIVHQALEKLLPGRTALIIAHRLSTVRNAHRIVVLSDGRIVEQGTHAELMRAGGLYRQLYESQDATAETAN